MTRLLAPGRILLGALLVAAAAGCSTDPVRVYDTPADKQRLLGAIILTNDASWFVKLLGNAEQVGGQADAFWKFVRSLRFPKDGAEPVTWIAPEGWNHETGKDLRYATFRIEGGLEVGLFRFQGSADQTLDNVNRWRRQLKLPPISGAELEAVAKSEKIDGKPAYLLDMENARTDAIPADPKDITSDDSSSKPIDYSVPAGWKEQPPNQMRHAGFVLEENGQRVTLTVSQAGGGIVANINRWRGQVGLEPASDADIQRDSGAIEVAGSKCISVDLTGPEGAERQRIVAVICPRRGGDPWFFKMMGPDDLVAKQKPAFEAFVRSVRFGGGK